MPEKLPTDVRKGEEESEMNYTYSREENGLRLLLRTEIKKWSCSPAAACRCGKRASRCFSGGGVGTAPAKGDTTTLEKKVPSR